MPTNKDRIKNKAELDLLYDHTLTHGQTPTDRSGYGYQADGQGNVTIVGCDEQAIPMITDLKDVSTESTP